MATSSQAQPTIVQPGAGKALSFLSDGPTSVMLGGEQTGGTLAVVLHDATPGTGPPLHVHARDDELFLVVEGTISYFTSGRWTDVGPGGLVYFPKGTPHCFQNRGTTPARHWIVTTPAGFDQFVTRSNADMAAAATLSGGDGPDKDRMVALLTEYGMTLLDETQSQAGS